MKKFCVSLLLIMFFMTPAFAKVDKTSYEYLKNKKRFMTGCLFAEHLAEKYIKKSLVEQTGGAYDIDFKGYTVTSIKKGIFKYLEISGKDLKIENIDVAYLNVKTLTDYNRLDVDTSPLKIISDITLDYEVHLTENSINQALEHKEYYKILNKINDIAYPLFTVYDVNVKTNNDWLDIIVEYNFPISPKKNNRTFCVSTNFKAEKGVIKANNVKLDGRYKTLDVNKVVNLVNLLDPLSFTLSVLDTKNCKGKVENVKIEDNIIKINGKIYIKGEK